MSKRKNSFNPDWESNYNFVKRSKRGDGFFYCNLCQKDYNVESMGVSAVTAHQKNKVHMQIVEEKAKNATMEQFVRNKAALNSQDFQVAAAEG
jgi:hypothetical protein